ncbi:MAG: hypothetical protein K9G67_15620 [Bacteroidales bacterium]|nr:hypothetical protein [Bacteroidales bacterium]MCF8377785.1 hypothetical protein [Bacteroidales bacterium]
MAIGRYFKVLAGATMKRQKHEVLKSGLFDKDLYISLYPDVQAANLDPIEHFLRVGWKEGKCPSVDFSSAHYLEKNPDVKKSGKHPFIHYLRYGKAEKRPTISKTEQERLSTLKKIIDSGLWDSDYYLAKNDDVKSAGVNPLLHFLDSGGFEGRNPSEYFDTRFYIDQYPDVRQSGINPLVHYILVGREEGKYRLPSQQNNEEFKPEKLKPVFQFHIDAFNRLTRHGNYLGFFIVSGWCHTKPDITPDMAIKVNGIEVEKIVADVERNDVVKLFGKTSYPNGFLKVFSVIDPSADLIVEEKNTNTIMLSCRIDEMKIMQDHELSDHEYAG